MLKLDLPAHSIGNFALRVYELPWFALLVLKLNLHWGREEPQAMLYLRLICAPMMLASK
jgi:hypothetical protein